MNAVVEFDPSRPSGEGQVPTCVRRTRRSPQNMASEASRAVLRELGIDPDAAAEAYWYHREARQNRAARADELARRQVAEELRRRAEEVADAREAQHAAAEVAPLVEVEDLTDTVRTLLFSAFLLFGLAGFLITVVGTPAWLTWGLSGTLATFTCAYLLLNREEEIPIPFLASFLKP